MIYFLAFILCAQGITTELQGTSVPTYDAIEHFEVEQRIDALLLLMQKRLVIMREVARTKWNHNLAIEDKGREQQSLANLADQAHQYGLDAQFVTRFFQAQMDASKQLQKNAFALWREKGVQKFAKVFSLKEELRCYIDQLNHEIMMLLSKIYAKPLGVNSRCILDCPISIRSSDYIEQAVWLLAISPLKTNQ